MNNVEIIPVKGGAKALEKIFNTIKNSQEVGTYFVSDNDQDNVSPMLALFYDESSDNEDIEDNYLIVHIDSINDLIDKSGFDCSDAVKKSIS